MRSTIEPCGEIVDNTWPSSERWFAQTGIVQYSVEMPKNDRGTLIGTPGAGTLTIASGRRAWTDSAPAGLGNPAGWECRTLDWRGSAPSIDTETGKATSAATTTPTTTRRCRARFRLDNTRARELRHAPLPGSAPLPGVPAVQSDSRRTFPPTRRHQAPTRGSRLPSSCRLPGAEHGRRSTALS